MPAENAAEAAVVEGVKVFGVRHLAEVVALLTRPEEFHALRAGQRTTARTRRLRRPIFATCAARPRPSERSRSLQRAGTTF